MNKRWLRKHNTITDDVDRQCNTEDKCKHVHRPQQRPSIESVMAVPRYADETYTTQILLLNHVLSPLRPDWDLLKLVDVVTTVYKAEMLLMRFPPKSGIPRYLIDKYMPGFFDEPAPYSAHIYGIIMDRVMHVITNDPAYKMLY
jgi:hypothetical protein